MATKQFRASTDPRLTSTQISIRVPYHYREQLQHEAIKHDVTLPMLIVETMQRRFPMKAPEKQAAE